ncbi:putative bifunctional diguanylate cyclase/phosphodiesterase [Sphingomonas aracearum]|uniref:EAL domain-containing protein n=1 Tax=Sphingomonas aracearum TaxID=2283317 RepID=A0A369VWB3_9SPHN|nr:EAL domain-containing protein [Sphingomonas aracearum]RDE05925.1 EAL domain-containing protein [Sphingomonas aracearum]
MKVAVRPTSWLLIASTIATLCLLLVGVDGPLDRALDPLRIVAAPHEAKGKLLVVEMDAESAAAIRQWPWPRENYAQVIDRLHAAGAASIVFDVDLSAASSPAGDAAMAAAIKRANGLVALPTFAQRSRTGERRSIDALPIAILREHAALASVSIAPDRDSIIRQAPFGTITQGTPRPSLSAYIAGRSGAADTFFPIDYTINPASLPRLSFVAVRDGRFDPRLVRGRNILIGGTAVEMADRYGTPHWGVLPGVIVQALATETLLRGVPSQPGPWPMLLLAVALGWLIARSGRPATLAGATLGGVLLLFAVAVVLQRSGVVVPLAPGLLLLLLVSGGRVALLVLDRFRTQRMVDESSGLPNRAALLAAPAGNERPQLAVVRIAEFDQLVAVLGARLEGDLIRRIADRVSVAAGGAMLYRLADRLLAVELPPVGDAGELFARLRAIMLQPVEVEGRRVDVIVSIGLVDADPRDRKAALTSAALAAEEAAREGVFWRVAEADQSQLERQVTLMGELDDALTSGAIEVHYQPKLLLSENRIVSVEALVRWRHPERGFIGPDAFIPLAEQTDRIGPLTVHVLETAMHDQVRWRLLGHDVTIAVNVSARLVASADFEQDVRAILRKDVGDPSRIIFEVTESATLTDPEAAVAALHRYRALGIGISMDDYGTGQSTLSYLRQLPLAELKIDRSFVQFSHRNRNDGLMVRSTIDLAHSLGLKVVAEGIEEEACLAFLRELGCDYAQGYHISRPLRAEALVQLLSARSNLDQVA